MKNALLHLSETVLRDSKAVKQLLCTCFDHFPDRLFVQIHPSTTSVPAFSHSDLLFQGISELYVTSHLLKPFVDTRVILQNLKGNTGGNDISYFPHSQFNHPDLVFHDTSILSTKPEVSPDLWSGDHLSPETKTPLQWKIYRNVVLGGTFDQLHAGHKILLTNAILRCKERLTIGLTEESMLRRKYLSDLIEPIEIRKQKLHAFCKSVDPTVEYNIEPISDPFGPSIVDPELEAVVASEETREGANAINVKRKERGLSQLDVHIFPLFDVTIETSLAKIRTISSSWFRYQLLGSLLRAPEPRPTLPRKPYLIGLTGGSGSGKTKAGQYLAGKPGILVVECDKVAHNAYRKETELHRKLVEEFSEVILHKETGEIIRAELGKVVFNNEAARQRLNQLVWPEVMNYCIATVREAGSDVAFFDAALLIEAGWAEQLHEIWVTFVSEDEAVLRITERDKTDEATARKRLSTQLTNRQRIAHANVVFYTGGEYAATHAQIDRAWTELLKRI